MTEDAVRKSMSQRGEGMAASMSVAACILVPLAVAVVPSLILAAVASRGWPGEVGSSGMVFCERSRAGIIKQPANAWSNLGFVFAGLMVGAVAGRDLSGRTAAPRNRMTTTMLHPTLYAAVAAFVGPGSFALHASTTVWGGKVDLFSMYLWAAFIIAYGAARLQGLGDRRFTVIFCALALTLGASLPRELLPFSGSALFGVVIGAYVAIELLIFFRRREQSYDRRGLWAAAALFSVAFGIWIFSRTDGPLCNPDSLLQGHALWHLLNAGAMIGLYAYYRSERRSTTS